MEGTIGTETRPAATTARPTPTVRVPRIPRRRAREAETRIRTTTVAARDVPTDSRQPRVVSARSRLGESGPGRSTSSPFGAGAGAARPGPPAAASSGGSDRRSSSHDDGPGGSGSFVVVAGAGVVAVAAVVAPSVSGGAGGCSTSTPAGSRSCRPPGVITTTSQRPAGAVRPSNSTSRPPATSRTTRPTRIASPRSSRNTESARRPVPTRRRTETAVSSILPGVTAVRSARPRTTVVIADCGRASPSASSAQAHVDEPSAAASSARRRTLKVAPEPSPGIASVHRAVWPSTIASGPPSPGPVAIEMPAGRAVETSASSPRRVAPFTCTRASKGSPGAKWSGSSVTPRWGLPVAGMVARGVTPDSRRPSSLLDLGCPSEDSVQRRKRDVHTASSGMGAVTVKAGSRAPTATGPSCSHRPSAQRQPGPAAWEPDDDVVNATMTGASTGNDPALRTRMRSTASCPAAGAVIGRTWATRSRRASPTPIVAIARSLTSTRSTSASTEASTTMRSSGSTSGAVTCRRSTGSAPSCGTGPGWTQRSATQDHPTPLGAMDPSGVSGVSTVTAIGPGTGPA
jgi:hypothetical protein